LFVLFWDSLVVCRPLLGPTSIANPDLVGDAKVWQGHCVTRTLLVEDLAAVSAVMLPVGEGEGSTATKADLRVDPGRGGSGREEGSGEVRRRRREVDA
jgi:hypothetical protein